MYGKRSHFHSSLPNWGERSHLIKHKVSDRTFIPVYLIGGSDRLWSYL
ncbi:hypothetical protein [Anabaena azotica]